jgi:hypothetical protein
MTEEMVDALVVLIPAGEEPLADEVRAWAAAGKALRQRSQALRAQEWPSIAEMEAVSAEFKAWEERGARLREAVARFAPGPRQ